MKHHRFTNKQGILTVRDSESGGRYKSKLEMNACIRYLMQPAVKLAKLQHPRISYQDAQGKSRRYTADLWVEWNNPALRPLAIEAKYQRELNRRPELSGKFKRVKAEFSLRGVDFLVLTEREILASDIEMMRFVFDHRNAAPMNVEGDILKVMQRHGELLLGDLISAVGGANRYSQMLVAPAVWRLVSVHQLRVNFEKILDATAKISVPAAI